MNSGSGTNIRGEYAQIYRDLWVDVATALQSDDEDERWRVLTQFVVAAPVHWAAELRIVESRRPWWRRRPRWARLP